MEVIVHQGEGDGGTGQPRRDEQVACGQVVVASPTDVETKITEPLESALSTVSELKHITSVSREEVSVRREPGRVP